MYENVNLLRKITALDCISYARK